MTKSHHLSLLIHLSRRQTEWWVKVCGQLCLPNIQELFFPSLCLYGISRNYLFLQSTCSPFSMVCISLFYELHLLSKIYPPGDWIPGWTPNQIELINSLQDVIELRDQFLSLDGQIKTCKTWVVLATIFSSIWTRKRKPSNVRGKIGTAQRGTETSGRKVVFIP